MDEYFKFFSLRASWEKLLFSAVNFKSSNNLWILLKIDLNLAVD